ncbi:hypothetical protein MUG91_G3745n2 [Manis pentadactyla]|nr:hypothetical protein MUG91_G3745n2 [Manis pentadactyla]
MLQLMASVQLEVQIDLDHHGVALVTSVLTLNVQTLKLMLSVQVTSNADVKCSDVAADGVSSGDISADAERPGIGTLKGTLKLMLSVQVSINADVKCSDVAADGVSSGDISATLERPGIGTLVREFVPDTDVRAYGHIELQVYFAAWQTLKLMLSVQVSINADVMFRLIDPG